MASRTRIVRWLRVLLPLLALAILSTMFMFSRQTATEPQIPYADVDAEDMARDPRMIAPEYAGVTTDGAELTLRAAQAVPAGGDSGGSASQLALNWTTSDGVEADLTAPEAGIEADHIALGGGVRMVTSTGWIIEAPRIEAATDHSQLLAAEGIHARGPFGELTAGMMELAPGTTSGDGTDADAGSILNFTGGVRLIYRPQR